MQKPKWTTIDKAGKIDIILCIIIYYMDFLKMIGSARSWI